MTLKKNLIALIDTILVLWVVTAPGGVLDQIEYEYIYLFGIFPIAYKKR